MEDAEGSSNLLTMRMKQMSSRDKSILAGLYLSKFNSEGLRRLGFDSFTEAFNVIGLALGVRPASVKNYRDEFLYFRIRGKDGTKDR